VKRLALGFLIARTAIAAAQTQPATIADFVERARAGTARFKDISVAVAESYVKVGPDFPAMGEHWVNGELIMRGEVDPARPAILTYMTVNGEPTLTGVVYAVALAPGEVPPLLPPGAGWHDHVGSVDEESLLMHHMEHASDDIRLVVMHAWIWQPNPAGMFVTDNWSLPYARVGLPVPASAPDGATRAISLLGGASGYYERLFAGVAKLGDVEREKIADLLDRRSTTLSGWLRARAPGAALSADDLRHLDAEWSALMADIRTALGPVISDRLEHLWNH